MSDKAAWVAIDGGLWHKVLPVSSIPDGIAQTLCRRQPRAIVGCHRQWTRFEQNRPDPGEICGHCLRVEESIVETAERALSEWRRQEGIDV